MGNGPEKASPSLLPQVSLAVSSTWSCMKADYRPVSKEIVVRHLYTSLTCVAHETHTEFWLENMMEID
jgi:hypothetical protein